MAKILVVDDEEQIRQILSKMLNRAGHISVEAKDGQEGLDLLTNGGGFDLVITDIRMPRMNGIEMLGAIDFRIPAIVTSGHHSSLDDISILSGKKVAFFPKPFDHKELLVTIAEFCKSKVVV